MASSGIDDLENCLEKLSVCDLEEEVSPILVKLQNFECPFTWMIDFDVDGLPIIDRMKEKLLEMVDEDTFGEWKLFVLNMTLCWEYAKRKQIKEAVEKLQQCEKVLDSIENSDTSTVMGDGLLHIILASKCYLIYCDESVDNSQIDPVLSKITPIDLLSKRDASSVYCMKGAIYCEYGFKGTEESVKFIEQGLSLYENCPHWHFLLGKSLGRLRRIKDRGSVPQKREMEALEKAAELSNSSAIYILLSQSYREAARSLVLANKKRKIPNLKPMVDTLNKKALDLMRKVVSTDKDNPSTNIKCALGLIKLPNPWKDVELAEHCIMKALSVAPSNPMGNHVAGNYFLSVNQVEKALEYYDKAAELGVYGAEIDSLILRKKLNKSYDMLPDLRRIYEKYHENPRRVNTLSYLGLYFYHVKRDFKEAFVYWSQIVDIDIHSPVLKMHHDSLFESKESVHEIFLVNMFKLIKSNNVTSEEREKYLSIIERYIDDLPDVVEEVKSRHFGMSISEVTSTAGSDDPLPSSSNSSQSWRSSNYNTIENGTNGKNSSRGRNDAARDNSSSLRGRYNVPSDYVRPRGRGRGSKGRGSRGGYGESRGSNDVPKSMNDVLVDSSKPFRGNHKGPRGSYKTPTQNSEMPSNSKDVSSTNYKTLKGSNKLASSSNETPNVSKKMLNTNYKTPKCSNEIPSSNNETLNVSKEMLNTNDKTPRGNNRTPRRNNRTPRGNNKTLEVETRQPGAPI